MKFPLFPFLLFLIPLLFVSCVSATKDKVTSLGGKGAYKGENFTLVWNAEKSFRDGALAVTTVAAAAYSAATSAAAEATKQVTSTNAAKVANAKTAADSVVAVQQSKDATAVAIEGINAAAVPAAP